MPSCMARSLPASSKQHMGFCNNGQKEKKIGKVLLLGMFNRTIRPRIGRKKNKDSNCKRHNKW